MHVALVARLALAPGISGRHLKGFGEPCERWAVRGAAPVLSAEGTATKQPGTPGWPCQV